MAIVLGVPNFRIFTVMYSPYSFSIDNVFTFLYRRMICIKYMFFIFNSGAILTEA